MKIWVLRILPFFLDPTSRRGIRYHRPWFETFYTEEEYHQRRRTMRKYHDDLYDGVELKGFYYDVDDEYMQETPQSSIRKELPACSGENVSNENRRSKKRPMNPLFVAIILLLALLVWVGTAFLFNKIGGFTKNHIDNIKEIINNDDDEEEESNYEDK